MVESSSATERRTPLQDRAHRRIEAILAAAEHVFAACGYDAATMMDISEASETSPGGLYRYFADKTSVARALLAEHDARLELRWVPILASAGQMPIELMVTTLLDEVCAFSAECPAFLVLLAAPIKYRRDRDAKKGLRIRLLEAFVAMTGSIKPEDALMVSNIFVETVKGMLSMFAQEPADVRPMIAAHYKRLLTRYLEDMLS
jgi:AcrR family transcriptional regulator